MQTHYCGIDVRGYGNFGKDAYVAMAENNPYEDNKELLLIPDAVHTDLYDGGGKGAIPFDKIEQFIKANLK